MMDWGGGKESVSSFGDERLGFSKMKNNGKPDRFWENITSCVLLSVKYLWDILVKMSARHLELWIWCPGDT